MPKNRTIDALTWLIPAILTAGAFIALVAISTIAIRWTTTRMVLTQDVRAVAIRTFDAAVEDTDADGRYDFLNFQLAFDRELPGGSVDGFWSRFYPDAAISNCPREQLAAVTTGCIALNVTATRPPDDALPNDRHYFILTDDRTRATLKVSGPWLRVQRLDGPYFLTDLSFGINYAVAPSDEVALAVPQIPSPPYRAAEFAAGRAGGGLFEGPGIPSVALSPGDLYDFSSPARLPRDFPRALYAPHMTGFLGAHALTLCRNSDRSDCRTKESEELGALTMRIFDTQLYRLEFSVAGDADAALPYYEALTDNTPDWLLRDYGRPRDRARLISAKQRFRIGPNIVVKDVAILARASGTQPVLKLYFFDNWR